ncbi:Retrovirus-related Pol polyprotein from transposon [Apostichopus japonicus]|uniref:Retrovirus-related Pol polyprotein from transposon n=1 Tax=Stichopus japonicus TaxID=307972 RepID=A0A2G8KYH1_STIJA|nr:Retrovirus-related Pol polyprotein from transposon [Apostichopus japonicus]
MIELDIITPSDSNWISPVVVFEKPDSTYRLAIDYRALNTVTKPSCYPIPTIDSILHSMHNSKVISTLDLKSGFWQSAVHPDDQPKTAFVCEGVIQFKRLPFVLRNASPNFQNLLEIVFKPLSDNSCRQYYPYIDNIVIHSPTIDDHFRALDAVFCCLREAGLTINPSKCNYCKPPGFKETTNIVPTHGM